MIGGIGAIYLSWSILKYLALTLLAILAPIGLYFTCNKSRSKRAKRFTGYIVAALLLLLNLSAWHTGVRQQDLDRSAFNAPETATLVQKVERKRVTAEQAQQDYNLTVESKDATLQEMREAESLMNRATVEFQKEKEKLKEAVDKPEKAQ